MEYWEGKTDTIGKNGFLVAVSVPLVHPEYWFLVLPPQVQEIWHPVFQLLAGSQKKCPAQEIMWQMRGVLEPPPRSNSGRVSPSSPSQAYPVSVFPEEE